MPLLDSNGMMLSSTIAIGIASTIAWLAWVAVYRLYLGPLAKLGVPGPRLAALTGLYEFYYECILRGKFYREIARMHDVYGPIVRIGPTEVHIKDPAFFNQLHNVSGRLDKWAWYYRFVGSPLSVVSTTDHSLHRLRRSALNNFFSVATIDRLEPVFLRGLTGTLCRRMEQLRVAGKPVDLGSAYRSLATDVVTEYSFPRSYGFLEQEDFKRDFHETLRALADIALWQRQLGWVLPLFMAMPGWIVKRLDPLAAAVADFQNDLATQAKDALAGKADDRVQKGHPMVLWEIVNSNLPPEEKSVPRLWQESQTLVAAGTETTGNALSMTTFYLLENPECARTLREELLGAETDENGLIPYAVLKKLPYLTAVINEGLRMSSSVCGRLPRINPREATIYKNYTIPPGTAISTTLTDLHFSPTAFPSPHTFQPTRWLSPSPAERATLEAHLAPFGRGSRGCLGINLAKAELYSALGNVFRRFEMRLKDTTEDDMRMVHDFFSPYPRGESKGLWVEVL